MITLFKDPFYSVFDEVLDANILTKNPQSTIRKDEDSYRILMTVPGLTKDDIKISSKEGILRVSYQKEKNTENTSFVSTFNKSYRLSEDIDESQIKGKVENGILELTLPLVRKKTAERLISLN